MSDDDFYADLPSPQIILEEGCDYCDSDESGFCGGNAIQGGGRCKKWWEDHAKGDIEYGEMLYYSATNRAMDIASKPDSLKEGIDVQEIFGEVLDPPQPCEIFKKSPSKHLPMNCVECTTYRKYIDHLAKERLNIFLAGPATDMWFRGRDIFDLPAVAPIWGTPRSPLSAEGQGWMIVGPDGTGKTTLACHYVKVRMRLEGWGDSLWGMPVAPLDPEKRVVYFGMDRPRQMQESFLRGITREEHGDDLERLSIHLGPPPYLMGSEQGQEWLVKAAEEHSAGLVIFDSRKDLGSTLDHEDVVGVARATQILVAQGIEVLILAHPKQTGTGAEPSLNDIIGHREVYAGLGSVLFLKGNGAGAPMMVHHLKTIREKLEPFQVENDLPAGKSLVMDPDTVSIDGGLANRQLDRHEEIERQTRFLIEANGGEAPSGVLAEAMGVDTLNLRRALKPLIEAGIVQHNGKRGGASGWSPGPNW